MDNIPLKSGYLYIFRASPEFRVCQSESDPVDHVFFDFFTHRILISSNYIEINPSDCPMLQNLLFAIKEDFVNPPHQENIAKSYLDILLYYLKDHLFPEQSYTEITGKMLQIIHNRPIGDLSVNRIALEMNHNVNHIIRCFKKDLGITPHKYIAILKVNLAIAYKRQGISQTEIARKLGFESLSAFSYFLHHTTSKEET